MIEGACLNGVQSSMLNLNAELCLQVGQGQLLAN